MVIGVLRGSLVTHGQERPACFQMLCFRGIYSYTLVLTG